MSRAENEMDQTTARVVWYYYIGNLTQQEIADRLGLTRLRVNRIIGQARTEGSVRIDVLHPLVECVALAAALRDRYGLAGASVVPALADVADQRRVIGEEVGQMIDSHLRDGGALGIGWGRTLRASLSRLSRRPPGGSGARDVVSLMGGLTRGSGINTFEVSTQFADALGAECWYLAAPLYCPSEESRQMMLAHAELAEVMRRARAVSVALVTCGDMSRESLIASMPMVLAHESELYAQGAVGDLLGSFLDAEGQLVAHPLNRQVMALTPPELKEVPVSILASGGMNKVPIIRGALLAGYVTHVVTDEGCARALLQGPGAAPGD